MKIAKNHHAPAGRAVERAKSFERMQGKSWKDNGIKNSRSAQGKTINMELCNGKRVTMGYYYHCCY
jgi:hypothetical protein